MGCLGTIDIVTKLIEAVATDGTTTLNLTGLAAEVAMDGTTLAIMQQTGDPLMQVNTVNGVVEGVLPVKNVKFGVTTLTSVLGSTGVDNIADTAGVTVLTFDSTPDLSDVRVGDYITVAGSASAGNNGTFRITAVNDGADTVTYANPNGVDEASESAATATIASPSVHDVAATRDYCDCNGLCYVTE